MTSQDLLKQNHVVNPLPHRPHLSLSLSFSLSLSHSFLQKEKERISHSHSHSNIYLGLAGYATTSLTFATEAPDKYNQEKHTCDGCKFEGMASLFRVKD